MLQGNTEEHNLLRDHVTATADVSVTASDNCCSDERCYHIVKSCAAMQRS